MQDHPPTSPTPDHLPETTSGISSPAPAMPMENQAASAPLALPPDLIVPWRWLDVFLFFLFAFFSLIVIETVAVVLAMFVYGMNQEQMLEVVAKNARLITIRQTIWFGVVLLFLYLNIRLRFAQPFWDALRFVRSQASGLTSKLGYVKWVVAGALLAILVSVGSRAVKTDVKLPIEDLFRERTGILFLMALGILLAPLIEEIIFRGFLYPVVARSLGVTGGVIVTGLAFGSIHVFQLWGGWAQIALICLVGIVFTYARARTGSLIPSYLMHLGYNTLLFAGFFISTSGLRDLPPPS